jgi:hypothetical protein
VSRSAPLSDAFLREMRSAVERRVILFLQHPR